MTSTFHVYPLAGGWGVQREGERAIVYPTQREAVEAARQIVRDKAAGQLAIHGKDGRVREHQTYGMTRIQDPPKKSPIAEQIGRAVNKLWLERAQSGAFPPRDHSSQK